jgi:hypothetical protein
MRSSHSLDRLLVQFDDKHLVANAGLVLAATLAQHLDLAGLLSAHVDLGVGNVAHKALTVVHTALAGGSHIDHVGVLAAGDTQAVLGHELRAPSTVGTFLRSFSWGHVRQLDVVSRHLLQRAYAAGAGPQAKEKAPGEFVMDVDSSICETYGLQKHGGSKFTYRHVRGYHPLFAVASPTGDVLHHRLRGGPSHTARGAASFLAETFSRVRHAGVTGHIVVRADSGFYNHKVVAACEKAGAGFSVTAKMSPALHQVIGAIPEEDWVPIPYFIEGAAVAETTYKAFATHKGAKARRLIVRRVPPTPGSQLALYTEYSYHPFITNRDGETLVLEADHRRHAEVENAIRDFKYGVGLNHLPSGRFGANGAWLALNVIAHNLSRWVGRIGCGETTFVATQTLRQRFFCAPANLTHSARRAILDFPEHWPWAVPFLRALELLRAVRLVT